MIVELHPSFKKSYKKRIASNPKLVTQTIERIELFNNNPQHPLLKDRALTGKKIQLRAFSVAGDIRIVYYPFTRHSVLFLDIGTHNQVY